MRQRKPSKERPDSRDEAAAFVLDTGRWFIRVPTNTSVVRIKEKTKGDSKRDLFKFTQGSKLKIVSWGVQESRRYYTQLFSSQVNQVLLITSTYAIGKISIIFSIEHTCHN